MNAKEIKDLIDTEINISKNQLSGKSGKEFTFEDGFIAGLEQAKYLIGQLEEIDNVLENIEESDGTKLAAKARSMCNGLTTEERIKLYKDGISIIDCYRHGKTEMIMKMTEEDNIIQFNTEYINDLPFPKP